MIQDVTDLEVYRLSMELVSNVYQLANKLPMSERDTSSQIRRASKSVPANIAEGYAKRKYGKEFKRFLLIALGSSDEVVTHLRIIYATNPSLQIDARLLAKKYKVLSKRLNSLHAKWIVT